MTPTVVENNLQRAIEKENEIDPEDQEGDLVITRVPLTSKLRNFFFGYYGTILLVGSNDQFQKNESWIFKNLIANQI